MEKYLPHFGLLIAFASLLFTQFKTKGGAELTERVAKAETRLEFLVQFLMKDAVLSFHSPDPKHKAADTVIERLVQGEELGADEIDVLADRIKEVAHHGEDKAARLKASLTLALMDEFIEAVTKRKSPDVFAEFK